MSVRTEGQEKQISQKSTLFDNTCHSKSRNKPNTKHKRAPPYRDITLDKEISLKPAKVLDDKMFHMFQNVGLVKDTTSTNCYRCEQNF